MNQRARPSPSSARIERRKALTHVRLLDVARELFSRHGIYWVTIEDITEAADLGKGTFYKYFDSKESLIRVLLQEGLNELLTATEHAVRNTPKLGQLNMIIQTRVDFFLRRPDYLLLLHQIRGLMQLKVEAARDLSVVYNLHLRRLAQLVKKAGGFTLGSAREVAIAIAAYTSGLLTYHLLFGTTKEVRRRRNRIVTMLEKSIGGR